MAPGEKLNIDDLDVVLGRTAENVIEKNTFETTEEFEARKAAAVDTIGSKTVVLASDVDQKHAIYDADKGAWFLTEFFPSNGRFIFIDDALKSAGLIVSTDYYETERIKSDVLRSVDELLEDYTGSNAMGATIAIQKWHHERIVISEISPKPPTKSKDGVELFAYADTVQVNFLGSDRTYSALRIDMPRDQALAINGKIGFAIVADLVDPVRVESQTFIAPEFDNPYDRTIDTTVFVANIRCGIAFGPDHSILATVQTRPPY